MPTSTRARNALLIGALLLVPVLAIVGAAVTWGARVEVRILVSEGKPREVAECMVQLRASWGECEVGMFTGTYPAAWDSVPELRAVRDAVRELRRRGGQWSFADYHFGTALSVCASLPARRRICDVNVQSALALALGETAPQASTIMAVTPATRRYCTGRAIAALRSRVDGAGTGSEAAHAQAALAARAHACGTVPA